MHRVLSIALSKLPPDSNPVTTMVDIALLQSVSYIAGALGVCVAAIYYVMNLRSTLDNRKAQLLMEYNKIYSSKEFLIDLHESFNYEWKDFDDFWAKYGHPNPVAHSTWISIFNSYGYALQLLKWNLVSEEMLKGYLGYVSMGALWEKFGSMIKEMRIRMNQPGMGSDLEYYYNKWQKKSPKGREVEYKPS